MYKKLFTLVVLLLSILLLNAQNDVKPLKVKFGKLSEEELKMTKYEKDPDAPAVILFDKGFGSLGKNKRFTRHIRIKIFKKTAYQYANISFELPNWAHILNIKGITYNIENEKVTETKLAKESIFEEKLTKSLYVEKITMPDVREGSIIELQYDVDGAIMSNWTFQDGIPTMWSEYELDVPDFYVFSKIGQGSTVYLVNSVSKINESIPIVIKEIPPTTGLIPPSLISKPTSSQANVFTYGLIQNLWIQKDVPAFKPEKYITSSADYLTRLTFYLEEIVPPPGYGTSEKIIKSWDKEAKELLSDNDYFGYIDKKSAMKEELAEIINDAMKPKEKVQAIFNYVGKTFQQTKNRALFLTGTTSELQKKGKLAPSEMNLIMMNMLRTAGIEVRPVLISTRNHGKIGTPYAVYSRFDRVIGHVLLEKDTFFIDVASFPHPIELLPFEDLNGGGYEFWGKDNYNMVSVLNKTPTRHTSQAILAISTEGELSGNITMTTTGYEAVENRQKIKELGTEKFAQTVLEGLLVSGKLEEQKFEKAESFEENSLKGNFKIKSKDYVSVAGDKMYINPLLCFGDKESPFANPERFYTVDYGSPKEETANLILTIPEGYKVEELPKMVRFQFAEGGMKYDYLIESTANQIKVNTKLSVKKTTYEVGIYEDLRNFYAKIIAKMGEQIVLTKVGK